MSYDIDLKDPVTKEVIQLPVKHLMTGGTFEADYDEKTGRFAPKPIREAHHNITYNYSSYYYDAAEGDDRFFGQLPDDYKSEVPRNLGIRGIYGKTGAESIPMLEDLIQRIESKYKKNGEWKASESPNEDYWKDTAGNAIRPLYQLIAMAELRPDGVWDGD